MRLSADILQKIGDRNFIIFDGVCVLCNGWVKFVLRFDRKKTFHFIIAQSDLGEEIYRQLDLKSDDYDTFVIVTNGTMHTKLDGVFALMREIGWPWRLLSLGRFAPQFLKDWSYDRVAKNRYSLFGKKDICMIPSPDVRARFIE